MDVCLVNCRRLAFFTACIGVWLAVTPSINAQGRDKAADENREVPTNATNIKTASSAMDGEWSKLGETLMRCALESVVTMFFIRAGTPPPQLNSVPPVTPPVQNNDPPSPPAPPPDPPTGGGETPPDDPPFDPPPPPEETPEPTSIVTALLGVGLTSIYAWRKRRRRMTVAARM